MFGKNKKELAQWHKVSQSKKEFFSRAHRGTVLIVNDKLLKVSENNELIQNEVIKGSACTKVFLTFH